MKLFLCLFSFSLFFFSACKLSVSPFSEADIALVSQVFQENQVLHEGLLKNPPRLSTEGLAKSIEGLGSATHPRLQEWKSKLSVLIPKNPKDIESAFDDLSSMALILVEIKKEMPLKDTYQQFFCPMVEKYWVAKEKEVRNPYSPEMRSCGELIE